MIARVGEQTQTPAARRSVRGPSPLPLYLIWAVFIIATVELTLWYFWPFDGSRAVVLIVSPLVFAAVIYLVVQMRWAIMDLTYDMPYPARFWLGMAHVAVYVVPLIVLSTPGRICPWPVGGCALALALCTHMVFPRSFHYQFANLLLLWWGLLSHRPDMPAFWPLAAAFVGLVALGVVHVHFRHLRNAWPQIDLRPLVVTAGGLFALAVPVAGLLCWATPLSWVTRLPLPTLPSSPASSAANARPLTSGDITWLLFESIAIVILTFLAIFVLQYLGRRFKRSVSLDEEGLGRVVAAVRRRLGRPVPRRRRRRADTLRERIIERYLSATERMTLRGWRFPHHMTAMEFFRQALERGFEAHQSLGRLTQVFERAKYSTEPMKETDLENAKRLAEAIVSTLRRTRRTKNP